MGRKPKVDKLILKIVEVKCMALEMGRLRTLHKLDDASKTAGWELADILSGKQQYGDKA